MIYNKVKHSRDNQISSLQLRMKPICKASALGTGHYLSPVVGVGGGGGWEDLGLNKVKFSRSPH